MIVDQYTWTDPCGTLIDTLDRVRRQDKSAERQNTAGCFLSFVFIVAGVLALRLQSGELCLLAVVGFVAGLVLAQRGHLHDLEDRKYEVPYRFLSALRLDIPPQARVRLDIDFRTFDGAGSVRKENCYRHSWLSLRGRLADGNAFDVAVTADVKRKVKHKHKGNVNIDRIQETLVLRMKLNPARWPCNEDVLFIMRQLKRPPGVSLVQARILPDNVVMVVVKCPQTILVANSPGAGEMNADAMLATMAWVYRAVRQVKGTRMARAQAAQSPARVRA